MRHWLQWLYVHAAATDDGVLDAFGTKPTDVLYVLGTQTTSA
jgi:hypothetical protein